MFVLQINDWLEWAYEREDELKAAGLEVATVKTLRAARNVLGDHRQERMIVIFDHLLENEVTTDELIREIAHKRDDGWCEALLVAAGSFPRSRQRQLLAGCDYQLNPFTGYIEQILRWADFFDPDLVLGPRSHEMVAGI